MTLDFQLAAFLTGIVPLAAASLAYVTTRDTLHPMIYLGAMACFLHAFLPLYLEITQPDELRGYLRQAELDYAQTIVFLGILSLAAACGGARTARPHFRAPPVPLTSAARVRLVRVGHRARDLGPDRLDLPDHLFGRALRRLRPPVRLVRADSGYVGEAFQFGLPGALLLLLARRGVASAGRDLVWIGIGLLPLLGHGLLGARRGPTFMALVGVGVMWYLVRARRPRLGAALLGGLAVGLLLLFLLANRDHIYLGTQAEFTGAGGLLCLRSGPATSLFSAPAPRSTRRVSTASCGGGDTWSSCSFADSALALADQICRCCAFPEHPEHRSRREGPAAHRFHQHHGLDRCDRLGSRRHLRPLD